MRRALILALVVPSFVTASFVAGSTTAASAAHASSRVAAPPGIFAPKGRPAVDTGPAAGRRAAPRRFGTNYFYVAAYKYASASGAAADFTQPRPWVGGTSDHSLGEIAVESEDGQQIVEVGWIVMSGDPTPRLFVFHWVDGTPTCYDACGWVQVSTTRRPGMALTVGSLDRYAIDSFGGNWWIGYQGQWIGYFPGSLWSGSFTRVGLTQWFGEVASERPVPRNDMGNGARGSGADSAAIDHISLTGGPAATPDGFTISNTAYYDLGQTASTSFRFGGPGSGIRTTTSLHASVDPSTVGRSVTFTSAVTPPSTTGTVTFHEGAVAIGTAKLAGGTARFTARWLPAGPNEVIASYNGDDAIHKGSTSPMLTQRVAGANGLVVGAGGALHWFSLGLAHTPPAIVGAPTWPAGSAGPRGIALLPNGTGGFVLGAGGALHWFSLGTAHTAPRVIGAPKTPGPRGIAILPNGTGGYVVGAGGALHWFSLGTAHEPPRVIGAPTWPPNTGAPRGVAILPDGTGGYVVGAGGALHWFSLGTARKPPLVVGAPRWPPGADGARGIALLPNGIGGYVVGAGGALHWLSLGTGHVAPALIGAPRWPPGADGARGIAL